MTLTPIVASITGTSKMVQKMMLKIAKKCNNLSDDESSTESTDDEQHHTTDKPHQSKTSSPHNDRTSLPIMQNSIQRRARNTSVTQRHRTVNARGRHTTGDTTAQTIRVEKQRNTCAAINRRTQRRQKTGTDAQEPGINATTVVHHHHPTETKSTLLTTAVLQTEKKRNMTRQESLRLQAERSIVTHHRHQTRVGIKDHPPKMESRQQNVTTQNKPTNGRETTHLHRGKDLASQATERDIPTLIPTGDITVIDATNSAGIHQRGTIQVHERDPSTSLLNQQATTDQLQ